MNLATPSAVTFVRRTSSSRSGLHLARSVNPASEMVVPATESDSRLGNSRRYFTPASVISVSLIDRNPNWYVADNCDNTLSWTSSNGLAVLYPGEAGPSWLRLCPSAWGVFSLPGMYVSIAAAIVMKTRSVRKEKRFQRRRRFVPEVASMSLCNTPESITLPMIRRF